MLEEVDDIDDMDFDPADFDPRKVFAALPTEDVRGPANLRPQQTPKPTPSRQSFTAPPGSSGPVIRRGGLPLQNSQYVTDETAFKQWQIVYPVYFDARRTHAEGRRVSSELAVMNPLAKTVADACAALQVQVFFEPQKVHPKDWANPGRVRVLLRDPETRALKNPRVKNKRHLYRLISAYLQAHPTIPEDALQLPIPGLPSDKAPEKPSIPRGWKMNDVLPLHSNALTGGGVTDNIFKDLPGGLGGMPGLEGLAGGKLPPSLANLPGGMKGLQELARRGGMGGLGGMGGMGGLEQLAQLGGMGGMGGMGGAGAGSSRGGRKSRK
ncbi:signal recognition particle, SRP19 subunit [Limtongia smithiae]|uniref:signal recognition particle, SRP19 subunit n=1 Tax=Limtongia smithiae TaxID=1125753 RepID=UPI0034CD3F0C